MEECLWSSWIIIRALAHTGRMGSCSTCQESMSPLRKGELTAASFVLLRYKHLPEKIGVPQRHALKSSAGLYLPGIIAHLKRLTLDGARSFRKVVHLSELTSWAVFNAGRRGSMEIHVLLGNSMPARGYPITLDWVNGSESAITSNVSWSGRSLGLPSCRIHWELFDCTEWC